MEYIKNWDIVKKRFKEFWALENHDRPLINVAAWSQKTSLLKVPDKIEDRWLDIEYVVKSSRFQMENQYFAGEAFPSIFPNLGPDIFAGLYGADLQFGENTSWSEHVIEDWKDFKNPQINKKGKWYKKIIEITKAIVEDSKGDYHVGITDIHPGMDALVSLRGPQELCMDLYDCPEEVVDLPIKLFEGFKDFYTDLYDITNKYMNGTSTWLKAFSEDKYYVTSCDFICMIAGDIFDQYVKDELICEAKWLDKNIFHLDGPGALRHLDKILEIKEINGVQWVPGAGALPTYAWPIVLKKIQSANKVLQIHIDEPNELEKLSEIIRPEGVLIDTYASSPQQADEIVKMATRLWKK